MRCKRGILAWEGETRLKRIAILFMLSVLLSACGGSPTATPGPTAVPAETAAPPPATAPPATSQPTPTVTVAPSAAPTQPAQVEIAVYFTDHDLFNAGAPPFEVAVPRLVPATANLPEAVLQAYFEGPTAEEQAEGLEAITSGFTGYSRLEVQDGIAHLYLTGPCVTNGAAYNVAAPLIKNLLQFEDIRFVKIYDAEGTTQNPQGETSSIPVCLEP
jgi:hypothetical protein